MKKLYMHLINHSPAIYFPGEQIVYAGKNIKTSQMVGSLYLIRKQQELSRNWRVNQGYDVVEYDYMIVYINEK